MVELVKLTVSAEDDGGRKNGRIDTGDLDLVRLDIVTYAKAEDRKTDSTRPLIKSIHTHTHTSTYNVFLGVKSHVIGNHHGRQYLVIGSNTREGNGYITS